ncbi:hypothetical protein EV649_5553 [Kribbella sp. VKM Ac-2569]|uniref:hypothetical protein n=1 Tax=Kribbella sp. VKM Ac-2569 TaxID=2512220 RepID=UPI00102C345E|nr:hypothetical protein [Kribbella sp. VKM Ac-2569]RZT14775.1 hypothetical protein EV649_5553 [Kribbella sp. VKM Ac-2569]
MADDNPRVVFLFDDMDLYMFPSLDTAEDWMEAVDVDAGEYTAAMTETGQVIRMRTEDGLVILELTAEADLARLQELLREYGELIGQRGIELDPDGFANRSWQLDWENRWPKWPRWLDRRLHPHGPVQA